MNPKSPKGSSSSNRSPYPLKEDKDGFTFRTDKGLVYKMAFRLDADYLPGNPLAPLLVSFDLVALNGRSLDKDLRVEPTVVGFLNQTFEEFPDLILTFTCSTEGDLERHRRILFGRWYVRNGENFVRLSHTDVKNRIYAATIFRRDHPNRSDIEATYPELYSTK